MSRYLPVWNDDETPLCMWIAQRLRRISKGDDIDSNLDDISHTIKKQTIPFGGKVPGAWLDVSSSDPDYVVLRGYLYGGAGSPIAWRASAHADLREGLEVVVTGAMDTGERPPESCLEIIEAIMISPVKDEPRDA